jgi:sugar phosphate isomerase/epimerase
MSLCGSEGNADALPAETSVYRHNNKIVQEVHPMGNRFKIGIVVDVVPIRDVGKGWEYFEVPASIHADPLFSDSEWEAQKAVYKADGRPCLSTSHMLGAGNSLFSVCGPTYDREKVLFMLEREFKRINELGVKYVGCWGGHFRYREGCSKTKTIDQAISSINVMADFAEKYGMQVALEPEADLDSLFPRYLEGVEMARRTGRACVKAMADLNYFIELDQPLEDIAKYPEYCLNVHIQGDGGSQPNVGNRERTFVRLFEVLKGIGYDKGVSAACPWVPTNGAGEIDYRYETEKTLAYIQGLRDRVYK